MHFGAKRQNVGQIVALGTEDVGLVVGNMIANVLVVVIVVVVAAAMMRMVLQLLLLRWVVVDGICGLVVVRIDVVVAIVMHVIIVVAAVAVVADEVLVGGERQLVDAVIGIDVELLARLSRQIRGLRIAPVGIHEKRTQFG